MLTVLSPAKRMDVGDGPVDAPASQPEMIGESRTLVKLVREYSTDELAELMNMSRALAVETAANFKAWRAPRAATGSRQAVFAFRGDVYLGFDADALDTDDLEFAQDHLRILSGLHGVLRPLDLVRAYRLEMGTALETPRGETLYKFWGNRIGRRLKKDLKASGDPVLVNLASNEYFKAIGAQELGVRVITPVFENFHNGKYKVLSFLAKRARGLMARHIVRQRVNSPEGLCDFKLEGYRYVAGPSDVDRPVFRRRAN